MLFWGLCKGLWRLRSGSDTRRQKSIYGHQKCTTPRLIDAAVSFAWEITNGVHGPYRKYLRDGISKRAHEHDGSTAVGPIDENKRVLHFDDIHRLEIAYGQHLPDTVGASKYERARKTCTVSVLPEAEGRADGGTVKRFNRTRLIRFGRIFLSAMTRRSDDQVAWQRRKRLQKRTCRRTVFGRKLRYFIRVCVCAAVDVCRRRERTKWPVKVTAAAENRRCSAVCAGTGRTRCTH